MTQPISVQIISFENFAALESYLKATKASYDEIIRKYEELLGGLLRDAKGTPKKAQEKWVYEIQQSLETMDPKAGKQPRKSEKGKDKQDHGTGEWVTLDPLSVFVGQKSRGIAELYFEAITELRETVAQVSLAISVVGKLKQKATAMGNNSVVVSFVHDVPHKIVLKSLGKSSEKYSVVYNFALVAARPVRHSILSN